MKKEWERVTRQVDYTQLPANLRAAIEEQLQTINGTLNILFCVQTESKSLKKGGLFGAKKSDQVSAAIVTPRWLVQALDLGNKKKGAVAVIHYLAKMQLHSDTVDVARKLGIEDYGIDVLSETVFNLRGGSYFIGLGRGAATEQFIETLKSAIAAANPSPL